MSKSRIFLYLCLSFIGGIFVNSITPHQILVRGSIVFVSQLFMLGLLILGIFLISIFWKHKKFVMLGFCLLFLVAGIWRHQQAELRVMNNELITHNDTEQDLILTGIVSKEPDIRSGNIKLTIMPEEIQNAENGSRHFDGKVLVTTDRYPEYQYGDKLKITGKLLTPKEFEDFNYKDYLAKEGIYSVMYWPEIELLSRDNYRAFGSVVYAKILDFKNQLRGSIYQNLSPPQSSILGAMILGDKRKISDELKEKLDMAGVRHITAISGMHVIILITILMTLLIGLGLWRQQAFYLTILVITLFIAMTGFQPSAIRAGIMGGLFLLAQYLGRQKFSIQALVFAATAMLVISPLLLRQDIGFQLSFLAIVGIVYLLPIFRDWIHKFFKKIPNFFRFKDILAMTLAAQVFTLPILIYNFGYMSSVAPITNILIVPFLPYIMGLGFVSGMLGIIFQPLGWVLSWPAWFLLTWVVGIVDWFSSIPLASSTIENLHWIWLIVSYLILGYITWRLNESQKLKFLNY